MRIPIVTVRAWLHPPFPLASHLLSTHTQTYSSAGHVQRQCGHGPVCCSSIDGVWTGAGTLWSTLWFPPQLPAWCQGGVGKAAAACSPGRGCCHRLHGHRVRRYTYDKQTKGGETHLELFQTESTIPWPCILKNQQARKSDWLYIVTDC